MCAGGMCAGGMCMCKCYGWGMVWWCGGGMAVLCMAFMCVVVWHLCGFTQLGVPIDSDRQCTV